MGCGCNMSGSGYSNAAGGGKGLIPEYTTTKVMSSDTDPTDDMFNVAPGTVIQEGTPGVVGSRIVKGDDSGMPPNNMNVTSSRKSAYSMVWIGSPHTLVAPSDTDPTDHMFNVAPGTVIQEGTPGVVGSRIVKDDGREPRDMVVTSMRKTPSSYVRVGYPLRIADGTPATTPKYNRADIPGDYTVGMGRTGGRGTGKPYVRDADMRSARSGDMRGLPGMTSFSGFDGAVATNNILRGRGRMVGFDGSVATNDILRGKGGMFRGFEG